MGGLLMVDPLLFSASFVIADGLKIVYDLCLYGMFKKIRPPEEK